MISENDSEAAVSVEGLSSPASNSKSPLKVSSSSGRSSPALSHSPSPITKPAPLRAMSQEQEDGTHSGSHLDMDDNLTETNNRSSSDSLTASGAIPLPNVSTVPSDAIQSPADDITTFAPATPIVPEVTANSSRNAQGSNAAASANTAPSRSRSLSNNLAALTGTSSISSEPRPRSTSISNIISSTAFSRSTSGSKINGLSRSNTSTSKNQGASQSTRRTSFGNLLSSFANSIRNSSQPPQNHPNSQSSAAFSDQHSDVDLQPSLRNINNSLVSLSNAATSNTELPVQVLLLINNNDHLLMSNSPTIANLGAYTVATATTTPTDTVNRISSIDEEVNQTPMDSADPDATRAHIDPNSLLVAPPAPSTGNLTVLETVGLEQINQDVADAARTETKGSADKEGFFSVRLTPLIDHSTSSSGLYFAPVIRKIKANQEIPIGRYTEKNRAAAHAPQGSSAPIVFKSKVVSRSHALFQCNQDGQWFVKDCKSSSGTFLNHVRLSSASQELHLMPLIDGDIIQLGMDYRGGTEDLYRCVKIRCEFNRSWQRNVNNFNLEIHKKLQNLQITDGEDGKNDEWNECAICLLKLEPCQALFISPCSHSWHYKCIRPIIIKSYPQFYCPNCRSMCDLETDIEDDDDDDV